MATQLPAYSVPGSRLGDSGPRVVATLASAPRAGAAALVVWATFFLDGHPALGSWVGSDLVPVVAVAGSLLLALLLVTTPRQWPVILLASVVGRAMRPSLSVSLSGAGFGLAVEILSAVLIASVFQRASRRPLTFRTLRDTLGYLAVIATGGGLVAFAPALVGEAIVSSSDRFQLSWRVLALSAVLGYSTVTPAVVTLTRSLAALRRPRWTRVLEAAALAALLLTTAVMVFGTTAPNSRVDLAVFCTLLAQPLWAAVRFGARGASVSLLVVTLISGWYAGQGRGPFVAGTLAESVLGLQLFLLALSGPLLVVSAANAERMRVASQLETSRRLALELTTRLTGAQEAERARIARELHDDLGQRLASLSISLSALTRLGEATPKVRYELSTLQQQTMAMASDLRAVSHTLHPARIEGVGLIAALRKQCEEVTASSRLAVGVIAPDDLSNLQFEVAMCLYRVAQEALRNLTMHAEARSARIEIRRYRSWVTLRVTDDGKGFDRASTDYRAGLGLISLEERVRLVGGTLTIDSSRERGTQLRAWIPIGGRERGTAESSACG